MPMDNDSGLPVDVDLGDVLDAVEANPVIAGPGGVIAVDALVIPQKIA